MKAREHLWTTYAVGALVVVAAMTRLTGESLMLERSQADAAAAADHDGKVRLALWRMDAWLSTAVALTTKKWMGDFDVAMAPFVQRNELVERYVRVGEDSAFGDELSALRDYRALSERIERGLDRVRSAMPRPVDPDGPIVDPANQIDLHFDELQQRTLNNVQSQAGRIPAPSFSFSDPDLRESIFIPMWVRQGDRDLLVWLQPNRSGRAATGFIANWDFMKKSLTELTHDLVPDASFHPLSDDELERDRGGLFLASAPIAFDAPRTAVAALPLVTPTRTTLAVAWTAILAAIAAFGVALKRTTDLSDRRSRFASSVTHELRTPLTTFRLYSEMLADGMVTDPAQRQTYLDTLKSESSRLATLVENVLAYSRVEEGRMPVRRERIAVADLLLRVQAPLERRARDGGATLTVAAGDTGSRVVDADVDVVGQILFNLIDNAVKYGSISQRREIELNGSVQGNQLRLTVRDHGPGIASAKIRAAFTPFERAGRPPGDAVPGIGLGLALSRALARDLGGDLDYEPAPGGGAALVLTLPTA